MRNYEPVDIRAEIKPDKEVWAQCFISKPVPGQYPSHEYLRVIHAAENLGFPKAYLGKTETDTYSSQHLILA